MKPGKSETTFQSVWLYKPLIVILCSVKHSLNWNLPNNNDLICFMHSSQLHWRSFIHSFWQNSSTNHNVFERIITMTPSLQLHNVSSNKSTQWSDTEKSEAQISTDLHHERMNEIHTCTITCIWNNSTEKSQMTSKKEKKNHRISNCQQEFVCNTSILSCLP